MSFAPLELPAVAPLLFSTAPSISTFTLDGLTDRIDMVLSIPATGTYTHVLIRQGTVTGTPGVLRVSLQSLSTSGAADGTILGSGNAYADYTPVSGNNSTIVALALTGSVSLSAGQIVVVSLVPQSGTWDGTNSCSFGSRLNSLISLSRFPYVIETNSGTATRVQAQGPCGLRTASFSVGQAVINIAATANFSSSSTPDEVGGEFTLPAEMGASATLEAVGMYTRAVTAGGTFDLVIYSGTTELASRTLDMDHAQGTTEGIFLFPLSTPLEINTGVPLIAAIRPAGANQTSLRYVDFATQGDAQGMSPIACRWAERTNAGAWSYTNTRVPMLSLFVVGLTAAAGGSVALPVVGGRVL